MTSSTLCGCAQQNYKNLYIVHGYDLSALKAHMFYWFYLVLQYHPKGTPYHATHYYTVVPAVLPPQSESEKHNIYF